MLEITGKHIAALTDSDLRDLIGRLCEAEVKERSISTSHITYGGHQDASDGGLDVRVELPADRQIDGYIPRPLTGFQVKATPMPASKIETEIRPNGTVRAVILDLVENSGSYILACSKESTADRAHRNRKKAVRDALQELPNSDNLHIDFYDQIRIASWVRSHPGIIPWVREKTGQPIRGWNSYGNWSNVPAGMPDQYLLDDHVRFRSRTVSDDKEFSVLDGIAKIRKRLSQPRGIVRLIGLSGVGKTRFAQALFEEGVGADALLQSRALYTNLSDNPDPQPQELLNHLLANGGQTIFIVDNCPPDIHKRLSQILLASSENVALLTVEYDVRGDDLPEDTDVFELRPSSESLIEDLLLRRFPRLSRVNAQSIAHFSGGNARIAIALAKSVGNRRSVAHLQEEDLFQRLFKQRNDPDNALLIAAQVCSLLYSFDGEDASPSSELALLGSLIHKSVEEMYQHVGQLIRRDLMQRRSKWRALLPHAIANRLAARVLEDIPRDRLQRFFTEQASPRMLKSFSRRLSFLHTNETAIQLACEWLSANGLVGDIAKLTDLGREVFRNIAPVAPEAALSAIERTVLTEGFENLIYQSTYAYTLRSIAYDANLFERCVACLARFAHLKSREAGWNEEGKVLASLFKLDLSGTHATIERRLSVIEKLLSSEGANSDLALEALKAALESTHFSSYYGFDFGSRERDYGFLPSTQEEVKHWYASTLALCESLLIRASQIAPQIKTAVADQLRGLWAAGCIYEEVEKFCAARASEGFWAEGWRAVRNALYYDGRSMPIEVRERLEILEQTLAPRELVQQVRGFVFNRNHDFFSPGEYYEEREDIAAQIDRVDNHAQSLGLAVASDRRSFQELLPEIILANGRVWPFACGLAEGAKNPVELWQSLVDQFCKTHESARQTTSLHAFLSCLSRTTPQVVSDLLDEAVNHSVLGKYFPGFQTSVEIDANRFQRLLRSLALGLAEANAYRYLEFGGAGNKFTATEFKELLLQIGDRPNGFEVAIEILNMRLSHGEDRGQDSESEVLNAGRLLLAGIEIVPSANRLDFELGQVISSCLLEESDAQLARPISSTLLDSIASYQTSAHEHAHVFSALFQVQPITVLDEFVASIAKSSHSMWILHNIQGLAANALNSLSEEALFSWCEQEPALRYPIAAAAIPFITNVPEGQKTEWTPVAIRLLKQAPDPTAALREFVRRSQPSSFWGSRADSLQPSERLLDELMRECNDESLLECIEQERLNLLRTISVHRQIEASENEASFE